MKTEDSPQGQLQPCLLPLGSEQQTNKYADSGLTLCKIEQKKTSSDFTGLGSPSNANPRTFVHPDLL